MGTLLRMLWHIEFVTRETHLKRRLRSRSRLEGNVERREVAYDALRRFVRRRKAWRFHPAERREARSRENRPLGQASFGGGWTGQRG
jgi:hypothetical protein